MDMMQRFGGRKFLVALVVIGCGMYLTIQGKLSAESVGLLLGVLGMFNVANFANTQNFVKSKFGGADNGKVADIEQKIEQVHEIVMKTTDETSVNNLVNLLVNIQNEVLLVKAATAQAGQAVINISKDVQSIKKGTVG